MNKFFKKFITSFVAVLLVSVIAVQASAASVESPWVMQTSSNFTDNVFLDALAYLGYDTTRFTKHSEVGSSVASSYRTDIGYNTGGATGLETSSGKPNVATFKSKGMCCASYATYVYFNYLPNVYGLDTSFLTQPSNPRSTTSWHDACETWVSKKVAKKTVINASTNPDASSYSNLSKLKDVEIGSILLFKDSGGYQHTGIYAGTKNGVYYQTNVGNSRGPEVQFVNYFQKGGTYLTLEAAYTPDFLEPQQGYVGVRKVDDAGNAVSGAKIGVYSDKNCTRLLTTLTTDSSGNAKYNIELDEGTTIYFKETSAPTGYDISTQVVSATVVADKTTYASTKIVDNRQGKISATKYDDAGTKLGTGYVFGIYSDKACTTRVTTMTTGTNSVATSGWLSPGTYYVKEKSLPTTDKMHNLNKTVYTVKVTSGATTAVNNGKFVNDRKNGTATVIKTSEDGIVEGLKFRLHGTADIGTAVDMTATTDSAGKATFNNVLIGTYTLEEVNVPNRYTKPKSKTVTVKDGQTVEVSFSNVLIKGKLKIVKKDSETNQPIAGAGFSLFSETEGKWWMDGYVGYTDANGELTFDNLPFGEYMFSEVEIPEGYIGTMLSSDYYFAVTEDGVTITKEVTNDPIKGNLKIVKVDGTDRQPLKGAGYRVYDSAGKQVAEGYTDDKGELLFKNLRTGKYTYKEFKAPVGFELDSTAYAFEILENGKTYEYKCENTPKTGSITVYKTDPNGNALEGVSFMLQYSVDGGKTFLPVTSRSAGTAIVPGTCTSTGLSNGTLLTGADGYVTFEGLRINTQTGKILYKLTETATLPGYQLLSDNVFIGDLDENSNIDVSFTVVNMPTIILPLSGDVGFEPLALTALGLALVAGIALSAHLIKIRKKKKKTH